MHWGQKRSARSRFFKANFDGFWQFSQKVLKIQKLYIPHLKALIYSYYEPEGQGVWCLHMTARLLWMKLELFSLKGVWQIFWRATPCIIGAPNSPILGLFNEVYNNYEIQLVLDIPAVKVERSKKSSIYLVKRGLFSIVQHWRLVYLEPLVLQRSYIYHFKALIYSYYEPEGQGI